MIQRLTAAVCFALLVGCGSTSSSDHEEIEHTRPDHWPDTFVDLVEQLEERFASRDEGSSDDELEDQLKWLPEIAGDTSLGESDWNQAVASGNELRAIYESGGNPRPALQALARLSDKTRDDLPPFVPGRHEERQQEPSGSAVDSADSTASPEQGDTPATDEEGADS